VSRRDTTSSALAVQGGTPVRDDLLVFGRPTIGSAEVEEVTATLGSGWLGSGPRVAAFETALGTYLGTPGVVAVGSGTAALHLAMLAAGIGPGDEVIVPSMTFAASGEVVFYLGATPVLADCDPRTLTLRAEDVEPLVTPRTRAIMPVHYAGLACDMDPIMELARARGLAVIDDAAHAFPSEYRGRKVGTLADVTAFSFYATKTLSTGEGGMLTTDRDGLADRARIMSLHGISRHAWTRYTGQGDWRYEILDAGYKYNMTDIAASLGIVQLRRQPELTAGRRRVVAAYDEAFRGIEPLAIPARREDSVHAWHLYPLRLNNARLRIGRDAFIDELKQRGIGTSVHFIPLHMHPLYRDRLGYAPDQLPNASHAFTELISLPVYSRMSDTDVARVIDAVTDLARIHAR
jgi:perosamine synthetase